MIGPQQAYGPPIAVNPSYPKLVMSGATDFNCSTFVGFYVSIDGGTTWTGSCLALAAGASSGAGEPLLGWSPAKMPPVAYAGGIEYFGGNAEVVVTRSTDKGSTWSVPVVAAGAAPDSYMDRPWLEVDQNPGSPRKGAVYISATKFNQSNSTQQIVVSHSTDRGQTWTQVPIDDVQSTGAYVDGFSNLAIGSNGEVYVAWMRCVIGSSYCAGSKGTMYLSKSKDGGSTWSAPHRIHNVNLAPGGCGAFYGCLPNTSLQVGNFPVIAVDTSRTSSNGRLYVVDYSWINNHMRVRVSSSGNDGGTWSALVGVAGNAHDQFFPWIDVSPNGLIGVVWLDRRNDPANHNYDAYAATSANGGASFTAGVRLSTVSSNPGSNSRMGEFTGASWTKGTTQKLFASWPDTRTGTPQDEVGGLLP